MYQNVLCVVFVPRVCHHVFLGTRCNRLLYGSAQSSGSQVPVQAPVACQVAMLWHFYGDLLASHHHYSGIYTCHCVKHGLWQHAGHAVDGFMSLDETDVGYGI